MNHLHQLCAPSFVALATIIVYPEPKLIVMIHDPEIERTPEFDYWYGLIREDMASRFGQWEETWFDKKISPDSSGQ